MGDLEPSGAPVSAALIGCGQIGSLYDEDAGGPARTHASALAALGVELVAVCDADGARAEACAAARGVDHHYTSADELFDAHQPDLVCIATPTSVGRVSLVKQALDAGAKALFLEKPLDRSLADAEEVVELAGSTPCAVNYMRSWSRGVQQALTWSASLGALDRYLVHYDKGFANNASHAVDLVRHFAGWPDTVEVLRLRDDGRDDRTADVVCRHGDAVGYFIGGDYRDYSRFEVELVFEGGRIAFENGGNTARLQRPFTDPSYPDYKRLHTADVIEHALDGALVQALASLLQALGGEPDGVACTLDDALATMRALHDVQAAIEEF